MSGQKKKTILVVFGTRPELIKLYPVIGELNKYPDSFEVKILSTAQHREMLDRLLSALHIKPDFDLDTMKDRQSLAEIGFNVLQQIDPVLKSLAPDIILVQGDTSTVFIAALAAFYHKILIGHIEAGIRSHDCYNPFPEEMNRMMVSKLAAFHYAPTEGARHNLISEGIAGSQIVVTGNTAIDALLLTLQDQSLQLPAELEQFFAWEGQSILITSHRRESWGAPLESIAEAVKSLLAEHESLQAVWPVHPNPVVAETVERVLGSCSRIKLIPPVVYPVFARLMQKADLILSDSGGIQEEAPSVGKMVLVLRELSDRPESVALGFAEVVGTDRDKIIERASDLLKHPVAIPSEKNPYGDGKAAVKIVEHLKTIP